MARFMYIARDKAGHKVTGIEDATNDEELIQRLQSMELTVVSVMSSSNTELNKPWERHPAGRVLSAGGILA